MSAALGPNSTQRQGPIQAMYNQENGTSSLASERRLPNWRKEEEPLLTMAMPANSPSETRLQYRQS
jgi:hypothetical protein